MTDDLLVSDLRAALSRPRSPVTAAEVIAAHESSPTNSRYRRPRRMRPYAIGAIAMATAICVLVGVLVFDVSQLTAGRPAGVPASWQKVTFGGLTMYAPGNLPVRSEQSWGDCGLDMQPFFKNDAVELDTGASHVLYHCPRTLSPVSNTPFKGLLIDPGPYGPLPDAKLPNAPGLGLKPLHVNGLTIERGASSPNVVWAVYIPGVARPVAVEFEGIPYYTILYSMRPSGSKPTVPPTTPSTAKSSTGQWPSRTITTKGTFRSIVATESAVYWLSFGGPQQLGSRPTMATPVRYDPTSGEVNKGPGISGDIASGDLAAAGGSVWVAVGSGPDVVVVRLDPTTLAIRDRISLPVRDHLSIAGPLTIYPVITRTINGPVWVAGGEDLWALNPATGAVETEFDAGDEIYSLSTDPTGSLLYTGGEENANENEWSVKEYDAQSGKDRVNIQGESVWHPTVAATTGGVWVSLLSGNAGGQAELSGGAGGAVELSAKSLQLVAPPPSERQGFGPFVAEGGVESDVSQGTLWLAPASLGGGNSPTLTCANPATGTVRANESTNLAPFEFIAEGHTLYALTSNALAFAYSSRSVFNTVVAISPPGACFG